MFNIKFVIQKIIFICLCVLIFHGCNTSQETKDPKLVLQNSCKKCHNLQMQPEISTKELAPPMMAVVFHLKDFIKSSNPSENKSKFVQFVSDYIIDPTPKKAYCDKKALKNMV